jgi:ATP-dependent Zn protease
MVMSPKLLPFAGAATTESPASTPAAVDAVQLEKKLPPDVTADFLPRLHGSLSREERAAYHEAGHAVAAFAEGRIRRIKNVTIAAPHENGGTLSDMEHWPTPALPSNDRSARTRLRLEAEIIILLGGDIAERRAAGRHSYPGVRADYNRATDLASRACGNERQEAPFLRWLLVRTEDLITLHWCAVQELAAELLKYKTLNGEHVRAIILDTPRPDPSRSLRH